MSLNLRQIFPQIKIGNLAKFLTASNKLAALVEPLDRVRFPTEEQLRDIRSSHRDLMASFVQTHEHYNSATADTDKVAYPDLTKVGESDVSVISEFAEALVKKWRDGGLKPAEQQALLAAIVLNYKAGIFTQEQLASLKEGKDQGNQSGPLDIKGKEIYDSRPSSLNYWVLAINDKMKLKLFEVPQGKSLSYQVHEHRNETHLVAAGQGKYMIDGQVHHVVPGSIVRIPAGTYHTAMCNPDSPVPLQVIESQEGLANEYDNLRVLDAGGRAVSLPNDASNQLNRHQNPFDVGGADVLRRYHLPDTMVRTTAATMPAFQTINGVA